MHVAVHRAPRGLGSFCPFAPAFLACSCHPHTCHLVVTTWLFHLLHPICIPGKKKDKREGKRQMVKGQPPSIQQFLLTSHWPERYHEPPWVKEGLECISFWPGTFITSPTATATQVLLVRRMGTVDTGGSSGSV